MERKRFDLSMLPIYIIDLLSRHEQDTDCSWEVCGNQLHLTGKMAQTAKNSKFVPPMRPLDSCWEKARFCLLLRAALNGLVAGDSFEFTLSVEDAYGEEDEEAYVEVPKSAFLVDGELDESIFELGEAGSDANGGRR